MMRPAATGLLALCVLMSTGCSAPLVRYQTIAVPGPRVYVDVPETLTAPIPAPTVPQQCTWPDNRAGGRPTKCNDALRAQRDAYADALQQANADRAAVRALSGRAVQRTSSHGDTLEDDTPAPH